MVDWRLCKLVVTAAAAVYRCLCERRGGCLALAVDGGCPIIIGRWWLSFVKPGMGGEVPYVSPWDVS